MKDKIFDIVYDTVREYENSPIFGSKSLKIYDNWKDELVDRVYNYMSSIKSEELTS